MPPPPTLPEARRVLGLARADRSAARALLAELSLEQQVALVCQVRASSRARLIELAPSPEKLVPALPEAELCYAVKGVGLHDAGWILDLALPEQIIACLDLDAWREFVPDAESVGDWIRCLADAGSAPLTRAVRALDAELLTLFLASRVEVIQKSGGDDFEPPVGAKTLEGQFYFRARKENDDLSDIEALLRGLFEEDYWAYFRLLQGVICELPSDLEEWALRWRTGRLLDLGFPTWEEAMAIYGVLPAERLSELPEADAFVDLGEWPLPIFMPDLPDLRGKGASLFRAMAALPDTERRAHLYGFISLANAVAVADRMPLGDAESIPRAFERAAELASRGLDYLAAENRLDPTEVLRRISLARLFRVGFNLPQTG